MGARSDRCEAGLRELIPDLNGACHIGKSGEANDGTCGVQRSGSSGGRSWIQVCLLSVIARTSKTVAQTATMTVTST